MSDTIKKIRETAPSYGSIPFWSWNDRLEEGELRRQIGRMQELGMSGFFMHARGGLETEYLSDEWFHAVNVCIDEAKKRGMEAWAYDENGWPSGFAGGKLLHDKKNFALGLLWEYTDTFPCDEDTVAAYTKNDDGSFTWVTSDCGAKEYLRLYRQYDRSYVDVLDGEITKEFLHLTHEEYEKRCGADFGGAMPGFFTDEPQYFRWGHTYSNTLPRTFRETYGYEIYPGLPAIFFDFDGADKFRFDYYKLLHEQFINNWVKIVYEWCEAHGVRLTGHAVEETSLDGQMMCIGGVMPFYEYEHIPGMDYLGRGISDDIAPKQLGSVCAQLGKKKALSEMFACCGWDVSPTELKRIADVQYASGVNLMCQHLYPYSERGQRKRDYPLHYSEHNPWQSSFAAFDRHYANLGAALAEGREYAPILVVHPIHGAYMKYKKGTGSLSEIEGHFFGLSRLLGQNQIPYHYGDENLMKKYARVEGGRLIVGECTYDAVVIPFTYSLDHETCALLREYLAQGGKLWLYQDAPACVDGEAADLSWLRANITFEELLAYRDAVIERDGKNVDALRKMTRSLADGSKLVFVTNITENTLDGVSLYFPGAKTIAAVSMDDLTTAPVYGEKYAHGITVRTRFADAGSVVYLVNSDADMLVVGEEPHAKAYIPVPERMAFAQKPENMMTLDLASLSLDGVHFDEPYSLYGIKDNLLRDRVDADIWLRYRFTVRDVPAKLRLVLDVMGQEAVTINGTEVSTNGDWWFDRKFTCYDIAHAVHAGENDVVVKLHHYQRPYVYEVLYSGVSESLRNCLVFDTEIECTYLVGDFAIETDADFTPDARHSECYSGSFTLTAQKPTVCVRDVVQDGYPFFGGHLHVSFPYTYRAGDPTVLKLGGRFATCDVAVNGTPAGEMLFHREMELAPYLREGENTITLDVANAMRNLMGPHHRPDPEPYGVGPGTFSFEKEWHGRECPGYVDRYAFVRFGIE